jgi:hypothetical protein
MSQQPKIFKIVINRTNVDPNQKIFTIADGNSKGITSIEKLKGEYICKKNEEILCTVKDPSIMAYYK